MATDRQLIERSLRGDASAFAEFYDRHASSVLRYAFALSHDGDDAQDLLQETFITAWRKLDEIRSVKSSGLAWLLVTCRNHAQNLRRSKDVRVALPLDDARELSGSDSTLDRLEREEELSWVLTTLELADPIDRRIVEACIVEGTTYGQAAEQLGISERAVAKRIQRLRSRLTGLRSIRQGQGS